MKVLLGNMFDSSMETLVNTVNCVGVMGKGVALEFKKRYPEMYKEYVKLCDQKQIHPGMPYFYQDLCGTSILVFPTKDHWRSPSKLQYIIDGLDWFVKNYQDYGVSSIAFPPLGCGNGGLTWDVVGPIMYQKLGSLPIEVEIYAPYGTKTEQLTPAFLGKEQIRLDSKISGSSSNGFNDRWLLILEVIRRVNAGKHTLHVGRVILQKICYILTRNGVQTGFTFVKGTYGPYAKEVRNAITSLSNSNYISEQQASGRSMIEVHVAPDFRLDYSNYSPNELRAMSSCVDLFCRIKNTEQAEMISTIIFEYDWLKKESEQISEQELFDGVMSWKKRWIGEKDEEVKTTIRNLAMLGLIRPAPSFGEEQDIF